jgi:transcriptional regulator with GAF, ATPase, and Fis domain
VKTELIGISQNIQRIKELISQVADTGLNILVDGETGVGKEVVAHMLYEQSNRRNKPFVKVNCAALPDTLLESEMFGYEQGAFTGAQRRKRGKFEQADGGLIFLDEIGDMSLPLQSKLLHVLQGGDFNPLGSEKTVKMGAWVIAATNHDLETDIDSDKFRKDLFYRLSTVKIHIEPLRNRPEDIPLLIDFYVRLYTTQFRKKQMLPPSQEAIDKLTAYHWPGNVRELQNVLKRLMILGSGEDSLDDMLMSSFVQPETTAMPASTDQPKSPMDLLGFDKNNPPNLSSLSLKKIKKKAQDIVEREVISHVLENTNWNRSKAAKILKISYKTLLTRIKDLNLRPPSDSDF